MDFKKLSNVPNVLSGTAKADVSGLEVVEDSNPLNALDTTEKIVDSKPKIKTKLMILDDTNIKNLMSLPRDKRRDVLSKLTDSQRRRVLERYKELTKVKDSSFEERLAYVFIDQALSNYVNEPTEYNKKELNAVKDAYKQYFSEETLELVDLVANDTFDRSIEEHLNIYNAFISLLEEQGIESVLKKAVDFMVETAEFEEDVEDKRNLTDSLKVPEVIAEELKAKGKEDASKMFGSNDIPWYLVEKTLAAYTSKGYDYYDVVRIYNEGFREGILENPYVSNDTYLVKDSKILDEEVKKALDKIESSPFIDENGNEVKAFEDTSVLQLLNEAITAYAEGDPSKLNDLANKSISEVDEEKDIEELEEEEQTSEQDNNEDKNEESDEEVEYKDVVDVEDSLKTEDTIWESEDDEDLEYKVLEDSINIAKGILNHTDVNKLIDTYKQVVPALSRYNFKITDDDIVTTEFTATEPIDMPMTRDEFCSIAPQVPCYFGGLVQGFSKTECPYVEEWESDENGPCITVNKSQKYFPYVPKVSVEEQLNNSPQSSWNKIISSTCVPLQDALHVAAVTNNLNLIDNKFYKKHLNDSEWYFDETPKCLSNCGVTSGSCIRFKLVTDDSEGTEVNLYGQNYIVS